ncbi:hypothetical protein BJX62DRAFT_216127 [Aspergillus germanicus]
MGKSKATRKQPDDMVALGSPPTGDAAAQSLFSAWVVQSPDTPSPYPIPSRWYIPVLLQVCKSLLRATTSFQSNAYR